MRDYEQTFFYQVKADMSKAIELWELGAKWGFGKTHERLLQIYSRGKFKDSAKAKKARAGLSAWYEENGVPKEYRSFK